MHKGPIQDWTDICLSCGNNIYETDKCFTLDTPELCKDGHVGPIQQFTEICLISYLKSKAELYPLKYYTTLNENGIPIPDVNKAVLDDWLIVWPFGRNRPPSDDHFIEYVPKGSDSSLDSDNETSYLQG